MSAVHLQHTNQNECEVGLKQYIVSLDVRYRSVQFSSCSLITWETLRTNSCHLSDW